MWYGREATFENAYKIAGNSAVLEADMVIGVGGGKCIDTVKLAADMMGKPVFTIPSIASNCAPVTQISIMYHEDGSFREVTWLKTIPVHCFIYPGLILTAPVKYFWAGIGDAMAKHVESLWSAKAGEYLDYGSELGITTGSLCYEPMLISAEKALKDAGEKRISEAVEKTILNIIISPGITSLSVKPEYNGAVAHALFYGLTGRKHIEEKHLHGEVVSYGTLVNLMLDHDEEKLNTVYLLHRRLGLPVSLEDLELDERDSLDDVLDAAINNQELIHTPYPVTKEMLLQAIRDLEKYHKDKVKITGTI